MVKCLPAIQETRFNLWARKIPWRRKWQPTPVLLPGKFHGWRSLVSYSPRGCKEPDMVELLHFHFHFPCGSGGKESVCNVGDLGLIPGLGRSPGEGNGYPFQYSCLEKPMDRGARQATVHGVSRVRRDLATKPPLYNIKSPEKP